MHILHSCLIEYCYYFFFFHVWYTTDWLVVFLQHSNIFVRLGPMSSVAPSRDQQESTWAPQYIFPSICSKLIPLTIQLIKVCYCIAYFGHYYLFIIKNQENPGILKLFSACLHLGELQCCEPVFIFDRLGILMEQHRHFSNKICSKGSTHS